jgi:LAS superfamily LD-carboxypeptidase LdcB
MPSTITPDDQQQHNIADDDYERKFNEGNFEQSIANTPSQDDVSRGINDLEQSAQGAPGTKADQKNDSASIKDSIRQNEANGDETAANSGWNQNYTGNQKKSGTSRVKILKRVGIFGGAGGIIGGALFLLSGFIPLGGLIINLGETATANRDTQNTILTKRLYKTLDSKLVGSTTSGTCSVVKIACRFSKPSNALLSRLDDYGIKALKADGVTPVEKTRIGFPKERPGFYSYTKAGGTTMTVSAEKFTQTLRNEPEFRKAFTTAFNMRYWGYADQFIKDLFYKKNDIDRSGKKTKDLDSKDPAKSVAAIADDADKNNKVKSTTDPEAKNTAAKGAISDAVSEEITKTTKKAASKIGSPVTALGSLACTAINVPGVFTKVVRAYQMRQEIVLAATIVLTASSMIKTGEVSPEMVATVGTLLTATSLLPNGKKTKSAMDSFGIQNVLNFASSSSNKSYQKFIPGFSAIQATSGISGFANNAVVKSSCEVISSPQASIAEDAVETAAGAAFAGVGSVIVAGFKSAIKGVALIGAIDAAVSLASPFIKSSVDFFIGQIPAETIASVLGNADISTAKEEDLGNVLGSGMNFFYSNAALSTGSAPLSTTQLASYNSLTKDTQIAYAEQDRVGRSPLDVSSPYTFLGSIVSNFYKTAYVPNNVLKTISSTIGSVLSQPFSLLNTSTYANSDDLTARCSHAADVGVDSSVGVGAFGDICAGIPAEYLNTSTADVLASVVDQVDENTGQPKGDGSVQTSLDTCGEGDLLSAKGCTITDQARANQSIYMYDLRVNDMLDGTNTDVDTGETASSTSETATTTVDMANIYQDSTSVACAPGTDDAGTSEVGYYNKQAIPIRLCSIPGTSQGGTPIRVNSRVSGAVLAMIKKMSTDLGVQIIQAADSFRKMSSQEHAWRCYQGTPNPGESCRDIAGRAAVPGTSNHQMGLAIDFALPGGNSGSTKPGNTYWDWLHANAASFGYSSNVGESWHWSATGG